MKNGLPFVIACITGVFLYTSCRRDPAYPLNVLGYRPIYGTNATIQSITFSTVQPVVHPGKMVPKDQLVLQVDIGAGIHIIDISNPAQARRTGFIKIAGIQDLSVNGKYVYANNMADMVALDLTDYTHPVLVNRINAVFNLSNQSFLPPKAGYFECPDYDKGTVVGWYQDTIARSNCSY